MTTFPKKVYTSDTMNTTLAAADLVPRGSLNVVKVNL
jgi:hypothetical protein